MVSLEWLKKHGSKDLVGKIWYTSSSLYWLIDSMKMGGSVVQLKILFPKSPGTEYTPDWL